MKINCWLLPTQPSVSNKQQNTSSPGITLETNAQIQTLVNLVNMTCTLMINAQGE